ncbi:hypothetical protein GCM10010278_36610 [Streptomyces melanogenes]|nr:hypothetical protein GCM10010278_36610 [Streptomyces melanogenes]
MLVVRTDDPGVEGEKTVGNQTSGLWSEREAAVDDSYTGVHDVCMRQILPSYRGVDTVGRDQDVTRGTGSVAEVRGQVESAWIR